LQLFTDKNYYDGEVIKMTCRKQLMIGDCFSVCVLNDACRLIAQQLVKMQAINIEALAATFGSGLDFDTQPCLFPTLYKWLEHVPDSYSNTEQQARLYSALN